MTDDKKSNIEYILCAECKKVEQVKCPNQECGGGWGEGSFHAIDCKYRDAWPLTAMTEACQKALEEIELKKREISALNKHLEIARKNMKEPVFVGEGVSKQLIKTLGEENEALKNFLSTLRESCHGSLRFEIDKVLRGENE